MDEKCVDIILPIYKPKESFAFQTIDSIINQTFENWHLIIVDDASNDGSLKKIKEKYEKYRSKISYYELEKNSRAAFARNFGIKQGNGCFIAFIDQDDVWVPQKLEWQVKFLNDSNYDAVHGNIQMINEAGVIDFISDSETENQSRRCLEWSNINNIELARRIFLNPNIRIISSMVKREAFERINGFKDLFFGGEDEIFWFEIAINGSIGYIDRILFSRREHLKNTVKVHKIERLIGYLKAIDFLNEKYKEVLHDIYKIKYRSLLFSLVKTYYHNRLYLSFLKWFLFLSLKYPRHSFNLVFLKRSQKYKLSDF